jgi:rhodanese-related sulfurtransferase
MRTLPRLLGLGLGFGVVMALGAADHTTDPLDTVKQAVANGQAVLVDVREQSEWDAGHLQEAKLLPLSDLLSGVSGEAVAKLLPKDKIIYCHCGSGKRCREAADELRKLGYDVRPLKPGYKDLLKAGFAPAEK